jgi:glycosyltransferase involved in cell wall biosynthesis
MILLPVTAIIPTKDREEVLIRTLRSLFAQSHGPERIIIVDASFSPATSERLNELPFPKGMLLQHIPAETKGAAHQRMQGIRIASSEFIFFMDDDIIFDDHCVGQLFNGFTRSANVGGVNAMITNQRYTSPGFVTRTMYTLLSDKSRSTYAGKVIGPAWNLLPEDNPSLPDYVECEWLNTT